MVENAKSILFHHDSLTVAAWGGLFEQTAVAARVHTNRWIHQPSGYAGRRVEQWHNNFATGEKERWQSPGLTTCRYFYPYSQAFLPG